jgi:small nuclear ribonucleoprotein (snRNP)-like protein
MMRGDEGCQHYLTQTFEKYLGVLRGYIATMNIYLFKKKEKKEKGNHICLLESGTSL